MSQGSAIKWHVLGTKSFWSDMWMECRKVFTFISKSWENDTCKSATAETFPCDIQTQWKQFYRDHQSFWIWWVDLVLIWSQTLLTFFNQWSNSHYKLKYSTKPCSTYLEIYLYYINAVFDILTMATPIHDYWTKIPVFGCIFCFFVIRANLEGKYKITLSIQYVNVLILYLLTRYSITICFYAQMYSNCINGAPRSDKQFGFTAKLHICIWVESIRIAIKKQSSFIGVF